MACSWVTVDTFFSAYETWARQSAGEREYLDPQLNGGYDGPMSSVARKRFTDVEQAYCNGATHPDSFSLYRDAVEIVRRRTQRVIHPDVRLPETLLSGPFNKDAAQLLLLLATQVNNLWYHKLDWELTRVGFMNILNSAKYDLDIARYMMTMWLVVMQTHDDWPEHVFKEEIAWTNSLRLVARDDVRGFLNIVLEELENKRKFIFD